MNKNKWFLNGGRGSGKSIRLLCEAYETKIADLKEEINKIAFARGNLEEENKELKHTIATLRQEKDNVSMHAKAMEVVAKTRSDQLTKAKEIIKKFSEFVNNEVEYDPEHPQEHTNLWNELCEEAEQFLRETDIDNAIQQANKGLDFDKIADEMEQDLKDSEVEK